MLQHTIPLPDQIDPLLIEWERGWRNFTVRYDGQLLLSVPEKADLLVGTKFLLPDGQALTIVLRDPEIELWYQGRDLISGIANGSFDPFQHAARSLEAVAGLQLIGALFYAALAPAGWKVIMAVALVCFAGLLYGLSKRVYSPKYKIAFWLGLVGCVLVLPLIATRRGGLWKELTGSLLRALRGKPPRFAGPRS